MREKLQRFMAGRYGNDQFNKFLIYVSLIILIVSIFVRFAPVYFVALAALIWAYFRMFSKNVYARSAENDKFLGMTSKIRSSFSVKKSQFQQRKVSRFYKCPGCGQVVRVPKGKGRIRITCPKCHTEFEKKT